MAWAGLGRVVSALAASRPIACARVAHGLAGLAVILMISDAFSQVTTASALPQLLLVLPFLLGASYFANRRAFLAAIGSAGFYITAVAMIYTNSNSRGAGWVGFHGVRMY